MNRLIAAAMFVSVGGVAANAHIYANKDIAIIHPWARPTPDAAGNAAVYVSLTNNTGAVDRLIGASSALAERVELHETVADDGVIAMRPIGSIALQPGTLTGLKPGEKHIMLVGLKTKLEEGKPFPLTLSFETAGDIPIELQVTRGPSEKPAAVTGQGVHHH
ncbi:copper chaperone PCu(A)C [Rhodomicrobium sp. Az07]|uniref:copper chaperone PCu(A)C n=1 Tax=Rhodomicrobium sp. Az07 TaxID=2839034 RepID=UPI001BE6BE2F|nr:copper chaperone PCu(A)C [Rhodomicrobium sp. Az07]MBT3069691.1 copper chaperone PCu(A)C [Rhodomicrobium sp. Az07]